MTTSFPDAAQIVLTEQMDKGLMMLQRDLGWHMIDMTYMEMLETKAGEVRDSDHKKLSDRPRFSDLPNKK